MFAAMAALLVVSLAIPESFGDLGLLFAGAYAVFRLGQIALFMIASADEPELRKSVVGLAATTAFGVSMLIIASFTDGDLQIAALGAGDRRSTSPAHISGARPAGSSFPSTSPSGTG